VRHRGTLGGSLAHDDPAADYPAAVLALGATVVTTAGKIPADDFFKGMFQTALAPDEVVTACASPSGEGGLPEVPAPGLALRAGGGVRGRGPAAFGWR